MHKCSYCGKWFKNYKEMTLHFDVCLDRYYENVLVGGLYGVLEEEVC